MMDRSEILDYLLEFRDNQLRVWPEAAKNYDALGKCERRTFKIGDFNGFLQYNPNRKISTAASTDAKSIEGRPCFLCEKNRPQQQRYEEIYPEWQLLVNPYPILPLHFTIAFREHLPQDKIPEEIIAMAERLPGMAVFFNGARAGASAPDHLHCQAVMASELPLLNYLEDGRELEKLPFEVNYFLIPPNREGLETLRRVFRIRGRDAVNGEEDIRLINSFFWIGNDRILRCAILPRKAHRPVNYVNTPEGEGVMVSPGAIDMAGIIVTPRMVDFEKLTDKEIEEIYSQTALPPVKSCLN